MLSTEKFAAIRAEIDTIVARYRAADYNGLGDACTKVVWDMANLLGLTYKEAASMFEVHMRVSYGINVN